jgi:hypothetical protein
MGRLTEDDRKARNRQVMQLIQDGYDHKQVGKIVGMRPQNAKALMDRLRSSVSGENIVTPSQQRETLQEISEKLLNEVHRIDGVLAKLEYSKETHKKMLELIRLKKDCIVKLADIWAIPSSIEQAKNKPSSTTGDKTQINFGHLDSAPQEIKEVTDEIVDLIDEHRS